MCAQEGALVEDPSHINSVFASFYKTLYSSELPSDLSDMHALLQDLKFPEMDPLIIDQLESSLTTQELQLALQNMQNSKAPVPEGFPVEVFKAFHIQLMPLLHSVYTESLTKGSLPDTLRQASVSVLLKKGKDPDLCTSYRPISLMNVDTEILSKALAYHLEKVLPTIISKE